jgi:hypothetical protein
LTENKVTSRRSLLGAAAAADGGLLMTGAPAQASPAQASPTRPVPEPKIIMPDRVLPPEARGGPDPATYLIFNDENGAEKGRLCASATAASFSLDYHNAQAITLATERRGRPGGAALIMRQMPEPDLPAEQASAPQRIRLGRYTQIGAMRALNDSRGRPRIVLAVEPDDVPRIKILDADGTVVNDLT